MQQDIIQMAVRLQDALRKQARTDHAMSESDGTVIRALSAWLHMARNIHDYEPTPIQMIDSIEKLPIDDQVTLVRGMIKQDYKVLEAPWLQLWTSRHYKDVLTMKGSK